MSTPRQSQTPAWAKNMQKLGPGVYLHNKSIHVSEAEICQHLGIRYTRENSALIEKAIAEILRSKYPDAKFAVKDHALRTEERPQ